jgi:hypothetical protein
VTTFYSVGFSESPRQIKKKKIMNVNDDRDDFNFAFKPIEKKTTNTTMKTDLQSPEPMTPPPSPSSLKSVEHDLIDCSDYMVHEKDIVADDIDLETVIPQLKYLQNELQLLKKTVSINAKTQKKICCGFIVMIGILMTM